VASNNIERYRETKKVVEKRRAVRTFVIHLVAYIVGNMVLGLWNAGTFYLRDNDNLWFWIPLLFWGVGVMVHYVYGVALFDNWWDRDERLVEERLKK